jgi:hypothetical protein
VSLVERGLVRELPGPEPAYDFTHDKLRTVGDGPARAAALNNLALVAREAGELDRALALTEQALRICAARGDRHREAAPRTTWRACTTPPAGRTLRSRRREPAPGAHG